MTTITETEKELREMQKLKNQMVACINDFSNRNSRFLFSYVMIEAIKKTNLEEHSFYFLHKILAEINSLPADAEEQLESDLRNFISETKENG